MLRRNPHVFGDVTETDPARINETWEAVKAAEKERSGCSTASRSSCPALTRRPRCSTAWSGRAPPRPRTDPDDLGDRLLALVMEARAAGVDPEQALRDAVRRISP